MKIINRFACIFFALVIARSVLANNRLHVLAATPNGTLWAVGTTGVFGKPERTLILRRTP
jgi:hypothetical protein